MAEVAQPTRSDVAGAPASTRVNGSVAFGGLPWLCATRMPPLLLGLKGYGRALNGLASTRSAN